MSDPLFPLGGTSRRRVRPRTPSDAPLDRPLSIQRSEVTRDATSAPTSRRGTCVVNPAISPVLQEGGCGSAGGCGPSSSSPSSGWQYTSSSRCLVCGTLGCTRCGPRPDPEMKRRKLETLRMNTPYARAKQMRATEELRGEEARRRQRLHDGWLVEWHRLQSHEALSQHVLKVASLEVRGRRAVEEEEQRSRRACVVFSDDGHVLLALSRYESEARYALLAEARATVAQLLCACKHRRDSLAVLQRERRYRETLFLTEAAERDTLRAGEANSRHGMQANDSARWQLFNSGLQIRQAITSEWSAGVERIVSVAALHATWTQKRLQQRFDLCEAAERGVCELASQYEQWYRQLREEETEAQQLVNERARELARSITIVEKNEVAARQSVHADVTDALHSLFLAYKASEEAAVGAAHAKEQRRLTELQEAVHYLRSIAAEEAAAFGSLVAEEVSERERRLQWVAQKRIELESIVQCSVTSRVSVVVEEAEEWRRLLAAAQQAEMDVARHIAHRARRCRELLNAAVSEKAAIGKHEHDARFQMLSFMGEHEEAVLRWVSTKAGERAAVEVAEHDSRLQCVRQEEAGREGLLWKCSAQLDAAAERGKLLQAQLCDLISRASSQREALEQSEARAFVMLRGHQQAQCQAAVSAWYYREQCTVLQLEVEQRIAITQQEMTEWSDVDTRLAISLRFLRAHAEQRLRTQLHELEAKEQGGRAVVVAEALRVYDEVQAMMVTGGAELYQAQLREREACMAEDERVLYDDAESLHFDVEASVGAAHAVEGVTPQENTSSTQRLKFGLCMHALGIPLHMVDAVPATSSVEAMNYLAALIDCVNARGAEARAALKVTEKRACDAAKRVAQLETQMISEREKKAMYTAKIQRDTAEREQRMSLDQKERQRGLVQLDIEKKRLIEAEAALKSRQSKLDALRKGINKQYKH